MTAGYITHKANKNAPPKLDRAMYNPYGLFAELRLTSKSGIPFDRGTNNVYNKKVFIPNKVFILCIFFGRSRSARYFIHDSKMQDNMIINDIIQKGSM